MDDSISRQDAIKEIARWIGYIDEDMVLRIQTGLKKLPSAQPEIVHCEECAYRRRCMLQHFVESNAVDGAKIDWSEWYCADGVFDISKSDGESEDDAD